MIDYIFGADFPWPILGLGVGYILGRIQQSWMDDNDLM